MYVGGYSSLWRYGAFWVLDEDNLPFHISNLDRNWYPNFSNDGFHLNLLTSYHPFLVKVNKYVYSIYGFCKQNIILILIKWSIFELWFLITCTLLLNHIHLKTVSTFQAFFWCVCRNIRIKGQRAKNGPNFFTFDLPSQYMINQ